MIPGFLQRLFTLTLALGCFILSASLWAQTPAPTEASSGPGTPPTPKVASTPQGNKKETLSSIFKKPARKPHHARATGTLGLSYNPEFSGSLLDYNKLNADLDPLLSNQPHAPTADEKFWGTVAGAAGYGIAGVAAAQAVGILPGERTEKK